MAHSYQVAVAGRGGQWLSPGEIAVLIANDIDVTCDTPTCGSTVLAANPDEECAVLSETVRLALGRLVRRWRVQASANATLPPSIRTAIDLVGDSELVVNSR